MLQTAPLWKLGRIVFCLVLILCLQPAQARQVTAFGSEVIELVKDIHPGPEGSSIQDVTIVGPKAFFTANDGTHGRELWVTDGTSQGTQLVKDLTPGSGWTSFEYFTVLNGQLLFFARNLMDGSDYHLYTSDGSEAGTQMVKEMGVEPDRRPVVIGQRMVFTIQYWIPNTTRRELWSTDGTPDGTVRLLRLKPEDNAQVSALVGGVNRAFYAIKGEWANYLGVTDGTLAGTGPLVDPLPKSTNTSRLFTIDDTLFFVKYVEDALELWQVNGISQEQSMIKSIPRDLSFDVDWLSDFTRASGNQFFFVRNLRNSTSNSNSGELWKSDGTAVGTQKLLTSSADSNFYDLYWYAPYLYFQFREDITCSLVRIDGVSQNKVPLLVNSLGKRGCPSRMKQLGNSLYYSTLGAGWNNRTEDGLWLWKTSGTPESTREIKKIGSEYSFSTSPSNRIYHNQLYLLTIDSPTPITTPPTTPLPVRLWSSDGTEAGTRFLWDGIYYEGGHASFVGTVSGRLLFISGDESSGDELRSLSTEIPNPVYIPLVTR